MKITRYLLLVFFSPALLFADPIFLGGVKKIVAGTNVTISPTNGLGDVTINSTGGGGGGGTPGGANGSLQYNNAGSFGGYTPGSGIVAWLQAPSSANLATAVTDETGTGALVFANSPAFVTPNLGTPSAIILTNATAVPAGQVVGVIPIANLATGTPNGSKFIRDDGTLATPAGSGTVTATSGALTLNYVVIGNGTTDTKVTLGGITTDGLSSLNLGLSGSSVGKVVFSNATTGSVTMHAVTGALGASDISVPAGTLTLATLSGTETFTNKTLTSAIFTSPTLGTPLSGNLTNCTNLPIATGVSGLGTAVAAFLATPSSANLATALTDETGSGVAVFGTSPALTTSVTTPSTTFALLNTTATTINMFGAATTVNTGASAAQIWNFGGGATASEFRFLEPSGSGVNYTGFKAQAQAGNVTYTLPAADGSSTNVLSTNGAGTLSWQPVGSGTVTVVGAGSLTNTALVTGGGSQTAQTPSATATLDSSGNIVTPGGITVGSGGSVGGYDAFAQGTATTAPASSVGFMAPASVSTKFMMTLPAAPATGVLINTGSTDPSTLSFVAPSTSGNVLTSNGTTWTSAAAAGGTPANPTGTVGLTAVNGSASTYMRSDGAPPLSQAITPTWSNLHTFSAGITSTAGTNSIGHFVDSVDGTTPLNNIVQTVASGTAYTMTTSYAAVTFGTTSPTVTLLNAGTYTIYVDVQSQLSSATITTQSVSFKLRRNNNTPADLTGATFGAPLPVQTAGSELGPAIHIGPIKYTTSGTTDVIEVQGILSASTGAGSVTASACTITAIRAY